MRQIAPHERRKRVQCVRLGESAAAQQFGAALHKCADKVACQCTAEVVLRLALRRNGLHLQPQSAQQRYKDLDRLRVTLDAKKAPASSRQQLYLLLIGNSR